ncbi:hypothetical protein ACWGPW_23175 [Paenibacillus chitinolyticus]
MNKVKHDLELLDEVIQKGFETLGNIEEINPATAIAAIQLKHKITKGAHGGYKVYGIEEIRLREAARENAITAAILEFVPKDQHNAVIKHMEQVTREYYDRLAWAKHMPSCKHRRHKPNKSFFRLSSFL